MNSLAKKDIHLIFVYLINLTKNVYKYFCIEILDECKHYLFTLRQNVKFRSPLYL